jgi:hypothetical protein
MTVARISKATISCSCLVAWLVPGGDLGQLLHDLGLLRDRAFPFSRF